MKSLLIALCLVASVPAAHAGHGVYRDRHGIIQSDRYVCRSVPGGYAGRIEVGGTVRHIVRPPSERCEWRPSTRIRYGSGERLYRQHR